MLLSRRLRNQLVKDVREALEARPLPCRRRIGMLAQPVDPDRAAAEFGRGHHVVEVALRDVHVPVTIGAGRLVERPPVTVRGL
jgi:hypothetical protein